jgi:hypothetical protein
MNEANVEPNIRPPATAARIAMAAVIAYQVLLLALIPLRPDLDPSWHTISEWASLARKNREWSARRLPLLWTAGVPLFGFLGFVIYTACFVAPLGPGARGPGVHIGWPPRFAFLSYAIWLISLAWQALRLGASRAATDGATAPGGYRQGAQGAVHGAT